MSSWPARLLSPPALTALLGLVPGSALGVEPTPLAVPLDAAGYRQIAQEGSVRLFKHSTSRDLRFAAEAHLDASPAQLVAVLIDYDLQSVLNRRVSKSVVLRRGKDFLLAYQRLKLPIVRDRDYVVRVTWGTGGGTSWVRYSTVNDAEVPRTSGVIRIQRHEGSWQFKPDPGGRSTWVRYEIMIDLAGWVPRWIARSRVGGEIPSVFVNLHRLVARSAGGKRAGGGTGTRAVCSWPLAQPPGRPPVAPGVAGGH